MIDLFNTALYQPLYNGLFFLTSIVPGADIGIAIIILTLFVKFALLPLTHKTTKTQAYLRKLEPEIKAIRDKIKDRQEQARQTMDLYKRHGVNPFSGCLTLLIQLPIILALYWVFWKGLSVDGETIKSVGGYINSSLLNNDIFYSFVSVPESIKVNFLGLIDMTGKSFVLALLAGISQYYQIKLSMPGEVKGINLKGTGNIKDDIAQSMKFQMRYILPIFVAVFAYVISAAVALYWVVNNVFMVVHELIVKKKMEEMKDVELVEVVRDKK